MNKLYIEKLVAGGDGLGRMDGRPVFVPLSAPGDLITPGALRRRRGVSFATIDDIVTASPLRRDPPCPYFARCGGCGWMHMSYRAQVRWKGEILEETLRRIGGLEEVSGVDVVPVTDEFSWRHRIRLHYRKGKLGFFRRGTHDPVDWSRCLIIPEQLNLAVGVLRAVIRNVGKFIRIETVELAVSPVNRAVSVMWQTVKGDRSFDSGDLFSETAAAFLKAGLECSCQGISYGSPPRIKDLAGTPLVIPSGTCTTLASPGTFFQVNPEQNENIVSRVLSVLGNREISSMLDLFCGNGNFSIPAARQGVRVTGVESFPGAVRDANTAAEREDVEFVNADVESFLAGATDLSADAVLVDPPRTGLTMAVRTGLLRLSPGTIVYVSCDPATLARDLKSFIKSGYDLASLEAFDMFPNSAHIESLVVLERK